MVCHPATFKSQQNVLSCDFPLDGCYSLMQGERTGNRESTQWAAGLVSCVYARNSSLLGCVQGIAGIVHCSLRTLQVTLPRLVFLHCTVQIHPCSWRNKPYSSISVAKQRKERQGSLPLPEFGGKQVWEALIFCHRVLILINSARQLSI